MTEFQTPYSVFLLDLPGAGDTVLSFPQMQPKTLILKDCLSSEEKVI